MKAPTPLILSGFIIFIFSAALGFGGLDLILNYVISKMLVLTSGSRVWDLWRTMPMPIYFRIRFFNITNPDELARGERAIVQELGPYTYIEDWEKVNITEDEENGTVKYKMTRNYYFQPELSVGSEDDIVTFINVAFLSTVAMVRKHIKDDFMLGQLDEMLTERGETLTKTATIRELTFDGFSVQPYIQLFNNPMVATLAEELGLSLPENIEDGKLGVFKDRNGSDHGYLLVNNGVDDVSKVAKIISHNDQEVLTAWSGEPCNMINGTDGTFYSPFLTRQSKVHIYSPLMCRSIVLEYYDDSNTYDLETLRFVASLKNWMSPRSNPDNWCFRTEFQINGTEQDWVHDGVFNIAPCSYGAPILLSQPHFIGADSWVRNGVVGMKPDFEQHMTMMDFHPLTGSPVKARARMQLNMELIPYPELPTFANAHQAVIPLLWVEESSGLEGDSLFGLQMLDGFRKGFFFGRFIIMGFGITLILIGILVLCFARIRPHRDVRKRYANTALELSTGRSYEVAHAYD